MAKTNNPEGINQYTGKAKAGLASAKVKVGGVFASAKEKTKEGYEAVDKTLKYGAAGAAIGGAAALGGTGAAALATKAIGSTGRAALGGAVIGAGAGLASVRSINKAFQDPEYVAAGIAPPPISKGAQALITANSAALGAAGTAVGFVAARALGAPTPAKIAAGAAIGGAIGAYQGYKADRAEEATRKATGHARQFKQV
jgi:hypothetical protein